MMSLAAQVREENETAPVHFDNVALLILSEY
jgi:hypothetical protein